MIMESSNTLMLLLFVIPLVYFCLHKLILGKHSPTATIKFAEKKRLPPGRTGWPFLGETWDYFSRIQQGVLDKFVTDRSNKYSSNVFRTSLIGQPVAILCNAEGNKFLFSNEKKLVQVWWPSSMDKIFPKSDNEGSNEHGKRLRKLLPPLLKADALREYVSVMDALMKNHLQTDWNCKQLKIADVAKRYVLTLACNLFLGVNDPRKIDEFAKETEDISTGLHSVPINLPGLALHRAIKASKLMRKKVETIIREKKVDISGHRSCSRKDFMSYILLATDDNGQFLSELDIASNMVGLVQAGYTTLHSTITMIMKYLAELPNVYDSVLKEQNEVADSKDPKDRLSWEDLRNMKHSWNVACEVLRLMPPAPGGFREVITEFSYAGYTIPRGWKLQWIGLATHKNPEYFPNPEKFDPSRFQGDGPVPYTFVPFGGGSRICPGYEYARIAILIFMHNVVTRFRWEKLIADEKILYGPPPRCAHGLPVRLHPHKP